MEPVAITTKDEFTTKRSFIPKVWNDVTDRVLKEVLEIWRLETPTSW